MDHSVCVLTSLIYSTYPIFCLLFSGYLVGKGGTGCLSVYLFVSNITKKVMNGLR